MSGSFQVPSVIFLFFLAYSLERTTEHVSKGMSPRRRDFSLNPRDGQNGGEEEATGQS